MTPFQASVIVRAMDANATITAALTGLKRQTVKPEIIVVDSGSQDGTVETARRYCDQLIQIAPEDFTYGGALNLGALAASAPFHFAFSAHCKVPSDDWMERCLRSYARADVAGVCGIRAQAGQGSVDGVWFQDADRFRRDPTRGFSNHASSWRAEVWQAFPFNEEVVAAEDKEWAGRVLDAGWVIACDPALEVQTDHYFEMGLRHFFRRRRRDLVAIDVFAELPPYGLSELLDEWWNVPPDGRRSRTRQRLGPRRLTDLAARYAASRPRTKRSRS